ncbi:MAG: MFS transporter [Janthinobacterium lividum]
MTSTVNAGARLDRLPTSSFHRRILWLIGGGMFLDSFDLYLAGGVLGELARSGWSSLLLNAAFLSSTFIGMLIGAIAAGILGDAKGRKFTYQFNLAIFGLASLAGAFAPNMEWLIACRFIMGLGLGAEIVVGYGSIGEFIPPAVRGKWSAYLSLITNAGLFFSTFIGFLLIPTLGWRAMFAIVGIGALVIWVLRKKMPESPRWLESKGRLSEANAILEEIEAETAQGRALPPITENYAAPVRKTRMSELFGRALRRRTWIAICIQVAINIVIYGFIVWVPTFLLHQGIDLKASLGYTALMSLGGPAGALVGALLADRIGRKNGIIVISIAAAVVGWFYGQSTSISMAVSLGFVLFTLTYLLVALGIATYIPELFATENRMRGSGVVGAAGRIAGIVAPQIVVAVYALGNIENVLLVIISALLVMAVVLFFFGVETNRRSLEDIAAQVPERTRVERALGVSKDLHH